MSAETCEPGPHWRQKVLHPCELFPPEVPLPTNLTFSPSRAPTADLIPATKDANRNKRRSSG